MAASSKSRWWRAGHGATLAVALAMDIHGHGCAGIGPHVVIEVEHLPAAVVLERRPSPARSPDRQPEPGEFCQQLLAPGSRRAHEHHVGAELVARLHGAMHRGIATGREMNRRGTGGTAKLLDQVGSGHEQDVIRHAQRFHEGERTGLTDEPGRPYGVAVALETGDHAGRELRALDDEHQLRLVLQHRLAEPFLELPPRQRESRPFFSLRSLVATTQPSRSSARFRNPACPVGSFSTSTRSTRVPANGPLMRACLPNQPASQAPHHHETEGHTGDDRGHRRRAARCECPAE